MDGAARNFLSGSSQILYPDFAKEDAAVTAQKIKNRLPEVSILSLLASAGCFLISFLYIKFFLPPLYFPSVYYLLVLALSFPAAVLQSVAQTLLSANLRHRALSALLVLPNLAKIALMFLLGSLFGIFGVVLAITLGAWMAVFLSYLLAINRELGMRILDRFSGLFRLI